ncbi:MAG: N-formylglutamate amidohydrolase [Rhodospirillaceae bacterium]|nr:N-formylglutamate amidohydrolase [Rhodospirillaceae bacterium]
MSDYRLLDDDEPHPVVVHREYGTSPLFFTCDHAGRRIPRRLGDLGLPATELTRHIAWDIGALATSKLVADRLDATLVEQVYSRLVVDCNRAPDMPTFIAPLSETTEIPGNKNLEPAEFAAREREIHRPYHDRIVTLLDQRAVTGRRDVLIAMHSFTPVFKDVSRRWQIGLLYNRDTRVARILKGLLAGHGLEIGDNEPYAITDTSDYGIPVHGEQRGIPHIEIEIRQDLIADEQGQREWAGRLASVFDKIPACLAQ